MKALFTLCIALVVAACGAPSSAQNVHQAGEASRALTVQNAWAAPTPSGVDVSAGYLAINNASSAEDRLLSVTSPRAERVEIHEMTMDGAVMRMRPVTVLAIAAGERVNLGLGGKHLMFYGVSRPFAEGEEIPVQLTFATAGVVDVVLPVRRSAPQNHRGH
jgi:periplasmic copper chaperone A